MGSTNYFKFRYERMQLIQTIGFGSTLKAAREILEDGSDTNFSTT